MKVYVLIHIDWDDFRVHGVFSTFEKARDAFMTIKFSEDTHIVTVDMDEYSDDWVPDLL